MLRLAKTHFYPIWKLHSNNCKDEMKRPLHSSSRRVTPFGQAHSKVNPNVLSPCKKHDLKIMTLYRTKTSGSFLSTNHIA